MLKKLALYSIAAITIGIITMMIPIGLIILLLKTPGTTMVQETYTKETTPKTLTEGYSFTIERLRETARFYGESDVAEGGETTYGKTSLTPSLSTPHNILASLMMVVSAGLLAALLTKLIMRAIKGR